ncbi:effector-associated constant component EACC1 [Virgisporangium ochraceum]|uniref:effector-associated constant component EACC1 n=1 Tax=Virgisporangium ochraceum TaxID=65505 RepID=UPI0019405443|nr:hypothetical protein [Virgisporangium ochraceum]
MTRYALHIRVSIPDDDGAEARDLFQWLAAEPAVRTGGAMTAEQSEPGDGQMTGGVLEAILLVVGSGVSLAQLFVAIASWRATRPRPYRVTVELPDRTIAIETADPDEALEIARRLESD